ncbi:hypothetical protein BJ138DRAFT_1058502 [Hygrophoropsis aurantiaca]|uniref:Uncharacterized protein n=1 Tax=Hygrophoropsis aurantiaca TaxID=72124 RepID=A0ACB8ALF0_9AGAM|nr:hypothetical protein BJ138DRAFT_1058502 [Hygrophoropsis aurantiaca]
MLTHRGFSAWIVSEGKTLPVYLVATDASAHRVSCWIPSEAGKTFSVHWSDAGSKVHSCTFITLDGFVVPGRFLFGEGSASREGVRTGLTTERPFVFAQHHDEGSSSRIQQCSRDVGTIMVKVKRVRLTGAKAANALQKLPDSTAVKPQLGGHHIGYGEEKQTFEQSPTTWHVEPHDETSRRSYVTFVFRYRSREFLLSQGIIEQEIESHVVSVPRPRIKKRRVASDPVMPVMSTPMTPSPSPSPNPKKMAGMDRMSTSLKGAFYPGLGRTRPATNLRTVSMKYPGVRDRPRVNDRVPGEGVIQFDFPSESKGQKEDSAGTVQVSEGATTYT